MAPESIKQQEFSEKSDVWAFGVTMIEIFTRSAPYDGIAPLSVASQVIMGELVPQFPSSVLKGPKSFLSRCFKFRASERPDFKEISLFAQNCKQLIQQ